MGRTEVKVGLAQIDDLASRDGYHRLCGGAYAEGHTGSAVELILDWGDMVSSADISPVNASRQIHDRSHSTWTRSDLGQGVPVDFHAKELSPGAVVERGDVVLSHGPLRVCFLDQIPQFFEVRHRHGGSLEIGCCPDTLENGVGG
ncbi:hypothetical protein OG577_50985 [Streptomyces canus]